MIDFFKKRGSPWTKEAYATTFQIPKNNRTADDCFSSGIFFTELKIALYTFDVNAFINIEECETKFRLSFSNAKQYPLSIYSNAREMITLFLFI